MQRKDMKEGMEVAYVASSKLWRLRSGPYGVATLIGDPNLSWEGAFPELPYQVAKGPGVLALHEDNLKIVLNVRQIAGPWNEIRKRIQATHKLGGVRPPGEAASPEEQAEKYKSFGKSLGSEDSPETQEEKAREYIESLGFKVTIK